MYHGMVKSVWIKNQIENHLLVQVISCPLHKLSTMSNQDVNHLETTVKLTTINQVFCFFYVKWLILTAFKFSLFSIKLKHKLLLDFTKPVWTNLVYIFKWKNVFWVKYIWYFATNLFSLHHSVLLLWIKLLP